jgi:hypothetical protein
MTKYLYIYCAIITILCAFLINDRLQEPQTTVVERRTSDTLTVTDTLWITRIIYRDLPIPEPERPAGLFSYKLDITDTLIQGHVDVLAKDSIFSASITYTPLFPKYIETTKTITNDIERTITVIDDKRRWWLGLDAGASKDGKTYVGPVVGTTRLHRSAYLRWQPQTQSFHVGLTIFGF